jgi:uroporphyrin-III C-methyltransferase
MSLLTVNHWQQFLLDVVNFRKNTGLTRFFSKKTSVSSEPTTHNIPKVGDVFIVGAGPGDAELLTLKAYRLLQKVDVVLYDWLVNPEILEMVPGHVSKLFVGKKCGKHSMKQADICNLMVETALDGKNIVRLKGGDPAIFARLAEECDVLAQHNIAFSIIPGVTAASGASAYTGIPLTHRECAQSVRFITAHLQSKTEEPKWSEIVPDKDGNSQTLVFYMGLKRISLIMQRLAEHGMTTSTEVAVIEKACAKDQQICVGNIQNIADKVEMSNFSGPAIIIVGAVVSRRSLVNLSLLAPNYFSVSNYVDQR